MATAIGTLLQAAAIPIRAGKVCLVTSRSGRRWVVPKGCLETGKSPAEIALQEAWEEAGLTGVLDPDPVGSYLYDKNGVSCHVIVYRLRVTEESESWPEESFREREWVSPTQAVSRIEERGLKQIVAGALAAR